MIDCELLNRLLRNILSLCEQDLLGQLEQKDDELSSEKKNAVKRDKTIQGLTQLLKEKEKEVSPGKHRKAAVYYVVQNC